MQRHWCEVAQLEHSSVASFARFTLDLMGLGAPADLLLATQEAAADEVRHARRAIEIASALTGEKLSFGELSVGSLNVGASRGEVLDRLIREACFNETLGVAEVTAQASCCDHSLIQAHLDEVRDDETRHAGLAWRSLQWILESAPQTERAALELRARLRFTELTEELLNKRAVSVERQDALTLNHFGVLTALQTQRAHLTAYHAVIAPSITALGLSQVA